MSDVTRPQLLPGERIVWSGKPYAGLLLRPIEIVLIPFSLLWGGFALFWNVGVWNGRADLSFRLFGLPFLIAGLYVIVGRFLIDMHLRRTMHYFVTTRRILIARGASGSNLKSLDIKRLSALEFDERADGTGTLRFAAAAGWFSGANSFALWQPTFDPTPQFIRVPAVRSLYALIQAQSDG